MNCELGASVPNESSALADGGRVMRGGGGGDYVPSEIIRNLVIPGSRLRDMRRRAQRSGRMCSRLRRNVRAGGFRQPGDLPLPSPRISLRGGRTEQSPKRRCAVTCAVGGSGGTPKGWPCWENPVAGVDCGVGWDTSVWKTERRTRRRRSVHWADATSADMMMLIVGLSALPGVLRRPMLSHQNGDP